MPGKESPKDMGIYDRPYASEPRSRGGGGIGSFRMLSVNSWIIIINVAVFLLQAAWPQFYVWSNERGHFSTFYIFGHNKGGYVYLEVWRLLTFQFLHASLNHVFFNMLGLWVFGSIVEEYLGRKKYAAFYLVCGIFGGLMYLVLNMLGSATHAMGVDVPFVVINNWQTPLVGASAGVFGVIMACAYIAPDSQIQLIFPPVSLRMRTLAYVYLAVAAFNLMIGGNNAGGDAAHVGGAIAGYFFIRRSHLLRDFFDDFSRRPKKSPARPTRIAAAGPDDAEIDRILAKVHEQGVHSLTERERKTLARASEQRRSAG
ncbi:MAG: rhomboid family intramembrane serine protease [Phycisphaerales bacterium]|nr:rhomboid family intramembrane serine protease [Phycisphaerales bacterium]